MNTYWKRAKSRELCPTNIKKSPVEGLRLIRRGNILQIVSIILTLAGGVTIVMAMGSGSEVFDMLIEGDLRIDMDSPSADGTGAVVAICGLILVIIASFMQFVGLVKTKDCNIKYKKATKLVVIGVVLFIFNTFAMFPDVLNTILNVIHAIICSFAVYFVINATVEILRDNGRCNTASKGDNVCTIYMICTVTIAASDLVASLPMLSAISTIIAIIVFIMSAVQMVALFMYIAFLQNAADELEQSMHNT